VRPDDEDTGAGERLVGVEEVRGPVQPDGRLAGARPALDGEYAVEGRADHLVLLGLDGGDDVVHLTRAAALELGQQGLPTPHPRSVAIGVAGTRPEQVV